MPLVSHDAGLSGGHIVISHPLGHGYHERLRAGEPRMVPHALPDQAGLAALTRDLPLRLRTLRDEPHLYLALLQVRAHACVQGSIQKTARSLKSKQCNTTTEHCPEHLYGHC